MGMGVKRMSTKKSSSKYDPETNEFKTYTVTNTQEIGDYEVTTSIETPGQTEVITSSKPPYQTMVVNPTVFVETGTGPEQSVPYPPNGPEISLPYGAPDIVVTPDDAYNIAGADNLTITQSEKFRMYPSKWVFVTFQKEGIHCWPGAKDLPGVEFLANPHRHLFKFRVEVQVFHDDREIEFILFKRELEKLYGDGILELDYKSCEMIADELAKYIKDHYPGRFMKIEVSEDGENGAVGYYEGTIKV